MTLQVVAMIGGTNVMLRTAGRVMMLTSWRKIYGRHGLEVKTCAADQNSRNKLCLDDTLALFRYPSTKKQNIF